MIVPKIDIVVLSYNRKEELRNNLVILSQLSYSNYSVIIVDNASTDGSVEMIENEFNSFTLIKSNENLGVSKGRNLGFKACTGEYIIYLDDDSYAPLDICEKMILAIEEDKKVACLAFLIFDLSNKEYSNEANQKIIANYHGAGHAFKRKALIEIDFLDEDYFFGGEEIDSSLRLMKNGYFVRYTPEILINHVSRTRNMIISEQYKRSIGYIKTFGMFYCTHFPITNATRFLFRIFLSFLKHGVIRLKKPYLVFDGFLQLYAMRKIIRKKRHVVSDEIVEFYSSPKCEPCHFARPVIHKNIF